MHSLDALRRALRGVEPVDGLSTKEGHLRLEVGTRLGDTGQAVVVFYLRQLDRYRLYQNCGHRSAVHYAEDRLGLKAATVLRRLEPELPRRGRVAITARGRIAMPATVATQGAERSADLHGAAQRLRLVRT